ncbi:terminal protein precursor pTP [Goose adenovirus 4]|uniref:Terminal protein pTP n=1 Tax=Goose adenovirus 4 TaxID=1193422 RepID=I3PMM7_9ADEN|nr:terminal protein precursor pTP [Goose adenovirus 4]AFC40567.1 terminal protein precursor pTP [Goose adenovirus 4]
MAAHRIFAELTGQSLNTIRFFEPILNLDDISVRHEPRQVDPRTVFQVSRAFDYRVMQLLPLDPGSQNVRRPPYDGLPPPHLLLGYQYMHRILNDYFFENRVFMQLGFTRSRRFRQARLHWTCLTDCSYSVDVGQYMRFLDLDNFNETFEQMHNTVLMDRVAADMGRIRGRGAHEIDQPEIFNVLRGSGASGLHDDTLIRMVSRRDANILSGIRRLRVALCHYLFSTFYDRFETQEAYDYLPFSESFLNEDWLTPFTAVFSEMDTRRLVDAIRSDPIALIEDPAETMAKCLMSTLLEEQNPLNGGSLSGGALQLRNRRVTARPGLRPRDRQGRAITASRLRTRRRRTAQRFIDRLPHRTRRTVQRVPEEAPPSPEPMEEEEMPEEEEEMEVEFIDEVVRTVLRAIEALQDELSPATRRHQLFQFGTDFYRILLRSRDSGMVTDSFLRKWVLYFFLSEHIASTLYYMYVRFVTNRNFARFVEISTLQVLITGWDVHARQVFKRIWSEQNAPNMFESLWSRILLDFCMMVERTGQFAGMDEADQQLFLSDIQYRDKSGDIDDVLNQLNLSEELIESIDISFRVKFKGITAVSTNKRIQANLRQIRL